MGGNRLIATAALLALLALPASASPDRAAPDFALPSLGDGNLRLSEFRGQVVLLTFWATWCGDCLEQLPALAELARRHAGRGVELLAVNIDRHSHVARELAGRFDFPVLFDEEQQVARLYDLRQMPVTLLIDQHGQVQELPRRRGTRQRGLVLEDLSARLAMLLDD
ncbi:MAG: TlpA family protein disulfide reductase [Chromatiales bacterium]|nr:TlpA family protein disulfide reductase [Chromatiales bacterium]